MNSDHPLISVVIPTYNEADSIIRAIEQFHDLAGRWELIVADSGSDDGTRETVARMPDVTLVNAPRGRGAGMNAGAGAAHGEILLFLHADTLLPVSAYRLIVGALRDPATAATAFRLSMDRPELRYRSLWLVSMLRVAVQRTFFGDQAIAVRRDDFISLGGYREPYLMEDVDLSLRLRRMGKLRMLPASVVTSARRFERHGVVRTLLLMTSFQIAYRFGISAERLQDWYAHVR